MVQETICDRQTCDAVFQGSHGAFGEEAALRMLPRDSKLKPCARLDDVFASLRDGTARYGVIPIESTIAGSVDRAYDLMFEYDVTIVGETVCLIDHALIGLPGARMETIQRAFSHPHTLAQCETFFRTHPGIEPVAIYDAQGAVQAILGTGDVRCAAIASRQAGELSGGVTLAESVQDQPDNYTRFLLISKPMEMVRHQSVSYKRTIAFRIANVPGALCRALEPFAIRGVNLAKIESRPVKGSPFEYMFYLDLAGGSDYDEMYDAVEELRTRSLSVRVMGMYSAFKRP